ncbi:unnamed protein product [Toxocara canis]|uniref:Serine/threonine-protein phosphatase 4 regulatory subunit 1 n=1 Tax=Toxocara canis TaxID=6265 RepID=A0A183UFS3_TOXCA|nr:unnamed protein product [Toxocara canis]
MGTETQSMHQQQQQHQLEIVHGEGVRRGNRTPEVLEEQICPALLNQTHYRPGSQAYIISDEQRLEAVTLLCKIITFRSAVSRQWIFDVFTAQFSLLLQDSVFHIRKACTSILGDLATLFGRNFTEQFIVPFLAALSRDAIWGVRKACCEVFVEVAAKCSSRVKEAQLAPRFIELLRDSSRWVCFAAFQQLGPFIATFADSTRTGLEIRDGRLAFTTDSSQSLSNCSPTTEDDEMEPSWRDDFEFFKLPDDVCLPMLKEKKSQQPSAQILSADEQEGLDGTLSAAAACSTESDLSKLVFDDDDDLADEEDLMDVEVIRASRYAVVAAGKDEDFNELNYWSNNFVDVDLKSYGRKAVVSASNAYVERRVGVLYSSSGDTHQREESEKMDLEAEDRATAHVEFLSGVGECRFHVERVSECLKDCDVPRECTVTEDCERATSCDSEHIVPKELLDSYVRRVSPCGTNEPDINRHCAHSFPAVAFTLGRRNWPQLQETYAQLASDMQWRVRQSLASSMHEVAAIIGEENADAHLVPVFEQFMKDVEDVRLGLLKHLYDFFKLVTPGTRRKLLTVLASFLHSDAENERNWRSRHEYTRQCALLCDLYDVEDVNEYIAAIALTLATDRVADVRNEAASLLARVLAKFVTHEWSGPSACVELCSIPITASFVNDIIKGFARSKNWRRRQTFAVFCEKTLEFGQLDYEQFKFLLLHELFHLGSDEVPNIRLAFARAMFWTRGGEVFKSNEDREDVQDALEMMLDDCDADCRRTARKALGLPDSENYIEVKGRAENFDSSEPALESSLLMSEIEETARKQDAQAQ